MLSGLRAVWHLAAGDRASKGERTDEGGAGELEGFVMADEMVVLI